MPALKKLVKETPLIIESYRNGEQLRSIAATYGVSHGTIRNILLRSGVELRSRGRRKKEVVSDSAEQSLPQV